MYEVDEMMGTVEIYFAVYLGIVTFYCPPPYVDEFMCRMIIGPFVNYNL